MELKENIFIGLKLVKQKILRRLKMKSKKMLISTLGLLVIVAMLAACAPAAPAMEEKPAEEAVVEEAAEPEAILVEKLETPAIEPLENQSLRTQEKPEEIEATMKITIEAKEGAYEIF